jgi:hypothetical protein
MALMSMKTLSLPVARYRQGHQQLPCHSSNRLNLLRVPRLPEPMKASVPTGLPAKSAGCDASISSPGEAKAKPLRHL